MENISGVVDRVTFETEDGYRVLRVRLDNGSRRLDIRGRTTTVVGNMPTLLVGQGAEFGGKWKEHPKFGLQFQAEQTMPKDPDTTNGIIAYLASGIVKGIGEATAASIVGCFGKETLRVLDEEPERLSEVPKLRPELAERLAAAWKQNRAQRDVMIFLQGLGISAKMAVRIHEHYGADTQAIVERNPYDLTKVHLIGFLKADGIAQRAGIPRDSRFRLEAGLRYAMQQLNAEGHVFAPEGLLLEAAAKLLGIGGSDLFSALHNQLSDKDLVSESLRETDSPGLDAIYLPAYHEAETGCSRMLTTISKTRSNMQARHADDAKGFAELMVRDHEQGKGGVRLTTVQTSAVLAAFVNKVSVITGCPGTGKTTCLLQLINLLESYGYTYVLCSPTGRAAKRMAESTGKEASTIHRLLGWDIANGTWHYREDNPLPEDVVVVDETSMLDLRLFHSLLQAIKPETHLLLVGDVDQLPSVGAGNVLRDVIGSRIAKVTRLDRLFRQSERSHITVNAKRINDGIAPHMANSDSDDFFFIEQAGPARCAETILDVVARRLPAKYGYDPIADIQVIAPMYRGEAGVNALNERLQAKLNSDPRLPHAKLGRNTWRVGDKVMQLKNNYRKGVFNGDIGYVVGVSKSLQEVVVQIDGVQVEYPYADLDQLRHAYCISTHKSQGSEYPVVVMPILTQHYMMLQRNLLYTAITRAKKLVVLVGTKKAVHIAVGNNKVSERHSGLVTRLQAANVRPPAFASAFTNA